MSPRANIVALNAAAFDAFAGDYDETFTHSTLGRLLRPRVWEKLAGHFFAGQQVLELACGTGEDALWLAQRGVHVTATDGSAAMIEVARAKAEAAGMAARMIFKQVSLQQVAGGDLVDLSLFDGVYSNFGGLNTIDHWRSLAKALAGLVRPGGKVILVPMGPFCPWEIVWHLVHGQPQVAFRRFNQRGVPAKIGDSLIPVWYPAAGRLQADFAPWFQHRQTESLGLWLPPSYLDHFVDKWPALFSRLHQFEKTTAHLTAGWGDHYLIVFERK